MLDNKEDGGISLATYYITAYPAILVQYGYHLHHIYGVFFADRFPQLAHFFGVLAILICNRAYLLPSVLVVLQNGIQHGYQLLIHVSLFVRLILFYAVTYCAPSL